MTLATQHASATSAPFGWERLATFRHALAGRLAQRRLYRATRRELDALSDRDLADLGVRRSEIDAVARQAADLA